MASIPASPVPHLTRTLTGPLLQFESHLLEHQSEIESWFRHFWHQQQAPFYTSVDLRNAGYKLAPVDTNLFPAGFNNLNPAFEALCVQAVQVAAERYHQPIDRILVIPESHTRNMFYLEHLAVLQAILDKAGFEVRLGSLIPDLTQPKTLQLESGKSITLEPLARSGQKLHLGEIGRAHV